MPNVKTRTIPQLIEVLGEPVEDRFDGPAEHEINRRVVTFACGCSGTAQLAAMGAALLFVPCASPAHAQLAIA